MRIQNSYNPYRNNDIPLRRKSSADKDNSKTEEFQNFLKTAVEAAEEINEIDTQKINEIKSRLAKNSYDVSSEKIAQKLFLDTHI